MYWKPLVVNVSHETPLNYELVDDFSCTMKVVIILDVSFAVFSFDALVDHFHHLRITIHIIALYKLESTNINA